MFLQNKSYFAIILVLLFPFHSECDNILWNSFLPMIHNTTFLIHSPSMSSESHPNGWYAATSESSAQQLLYTIKLENKKVINKWEQVNKACKT